MKLCRTGLTFLAAALLGTGLLAGCGDDDSTASSSDSDPQAVLDAALGGEQQIDSGVLDLTFDVEASGSSPGTISASLQGPFVSGGEGQLPLIDFTASATADAAETSFDFEGGLTVTEDAAYVSFGGVDYEVDDATFQLVRDAYEQSSQLQESQGESGSLADFGVDPADWVSELTNEGTEEIDGTEVVHVSGAADISRIIDDLRTIAERTPQSTQVDTAALDQLEESVTGATLDVYATADDSTLRRLDLSVSIDDPRGEGAVEAVLSIGIADPNGEQEISAPSDPQPLAGLLEQIPGGAEALGGVPGVEDAGGSGGSTEGGGAAVPDADAAAAYYQCAAEAQTEADLDACAALLTP